MKGNATKDPAVARIIERQMRTWELVRDRRITAWPHQQRDVAEFICISREAGVGACNIGVQLGERLGWPIFDRALLHAMAGDDTVREQVYASMDERDISWCEQVLRPLMQPGFVRDDYFHRLSKTVLSLARQGSGVFIGRGADLILPQHVGLRVRIIAPLVTRIQQIVSRYEMSATDARSKIQQIEQDRATYIRTHFHVDVTDPSRYDLVVNLQRISASRAVDVIMATREILAITPEDGRKSV